MSDGLRSPDRNPASITPQAYGHGAPSHSAAPDADVPRFLSSATCRAIIDQLHAYGVAETFRVDLTSRWRGDVRWARNRILSNNDWRTNTVVLGILDGELALNQVDATSLRAVAERVHQLRHLLSIADEPAVAYYANQLTYPGTHIWSEATYQHAPEERVVTVAQLSATVEQAGMVSAGYLAVEAFGTAYWLESGRFLYAPQTVAQCSVTVRDPAGTGSGWAGASSYDWSRIDPQKLAAIALDKCLKSRNPVKLEPGRYTTILEPQAAYELVSTVLSGGVGDSGYIALEDNENDEKDRIRIPFTDAPTVFKYPKASRFAQVSYGKTRLGQQVFDPRIMVRSDPLDPDLGTLPFSYWEGDPFVPVTWIEHGVLKTLATGSRYAVTALRQQPQPWSGAFRLEGSDPPVSIDDMIATTKRGLLVTRLWDVRILDIASVLCTGMTRDGLWLIEDGKIVKPVQNFRFTESPLFAFNNVEQIGAAVPIFHPECPAVVPAVKIRDFNFTSLVDAV